MTGVSILLPTVSGREAYLQQTVSAYLAHTPSDVDLEFIILRDRPTCGIGWQEATMKASNWYLHFSNDDVMPWHGWLMPLAEVVDRGDVAAPWISHGPWGQFYAAPEGQIATDWVPIDHSAMPFMSAEQFREIGPIIATHYGVDNWIAERTRAVGMEVIGRAASVVCHFAARAGREKGDWTEQDFLDYDCGIALPEYRAGIRPPTELPSDRGTAHGLARARQWRRENVGV